MAVKYKILVSLIVAGVVIFGSAVGGLWWLQTGPLEALQARGLGLLMLPGTVAVLFVLGYAWYKIFMLMLFLTRVDLDD